MTEESNTEVNGNTATDVYIESVQDFGAFITRWHELCTTKLSTIIAAEDIRIMLQEANNEQVEANKDTAYGFVRGLMHALEVFELPFAVVDVDPVYDTVH